jgi:hypothetical protein
MPIPDVSTEQQGPGTLPAEWRKGDYLLVSAGRWKNGKRGRVPPLSKLIQYGQGRRFRAERQRFAHWNHAVWVSEGSLVEVSGGRIRRSPYAKYQDIEFLLVHSNLTDVQRDDADAFVSYVLEQHAKFGVGTLVSISLSLGTGLRFSFGIPGTFICSGLVAAALAAPRWRENPSHVMPADLAEYADIAFE